jgi:hypothetical protein
MTIKSTIKVKNIECRDAILAWDRIELVCDEQGKPVTRWDGRTFKRHPVTGKSVPDETARVGSKSTSIPPQPPGPMPTSSSATRLTSAARTSVPNSEMAMPKVCGRRIPN